MTIDIELRYFPGPWHYASDSVPRSYRDSLPLSIFSLHVELVSRAGNLLYSDQSKGFYFFRDSGIPLPRPCTIAAWQRICCLGRHDSTQFYLPFLPSLREEDELGSAIGERGSRIASLSRKSKYHITDSDDRILWGPVYGGDMETGGISWQSARSDFEESQITAAANWRNHLTNESIRDRMVFLAQHGFPSTNALMKHLSIPRIYRLLFQFTSRTDAEAWAKAYVDMSLHISLDPPSIAADFKQMTHDMVQARMNQSQDSDETSQGESGDSGGRNNISRKGRFSGLADIEF